MLERKFIKTSGISGFRDEKARDVVIVMPAVAMELAGRAAEVMARRTNADGLLVVAEDDLRLGFIMTANLVYARTDSSFFAYVAQDAFPGQYWLDYGLASLRAARAGLLAFSDGRFFGSIAVFGLANRSWLRLVYHNLLFHPEYKSHFADTELSVIASKTGKLIYNPNAILLEVDYGKHLHGNSPEDEALYRKRARAGFDGKIAPFVPE